MAKSAPRILILGDALVDGYLDAAPVGISDEAPVTVLEWKTMTRCLGGMLNVAAGLAALECQVEAVAVVGEDDAGVFVRQECAAMGVGTEFFGDGRPTMEKTRLEADGIMLARLDVEEIETVDAVLTNRILDHVRSRADQVDAIVVSDYAKGLVTPELARALVKIAHANDCRLLVDAKPNLIPFFSGADLIKPNEREARSVARAMDHAGADGGIEALGAELARSLHSHLLITRSGDGMDLFSPQGDHLGHVPAMADGRGATVSGAGDVVLATLAASCAGSRSWLDAARHAARLLARAMGRPGTCRILPEDTSGGDR